MNKSNTGQSNSIAKIFLCASGASMTAEAFTMPIDITKVRLQLQGELDRNSVRKYRGMLHAIYTISKEEGTLALYKGLSPALLRQFVYSGLRVSTYEPVKQLLGTNDPSQPAPLWKKIVAGASTGAFAASVAVPTDLVKVRFQAQGKLKPGEVPRYKGLFHAFYTIAKTEGIRGLWTGVVPTVQRAALINAAELSTYDQCKQLLISNNITGDNVYAHFGASFMAGFIATVVSNPVDLMKTRIMNQKTKVYNGMIDCLVKTVKNEGFMTLYQGFIPNYTRIGPWCVVMFTTFEQLKRILP